MRERFNPLRKTGPVHNNGYVTPRQDPFSFLRHYYCKCGDPKREREIKMLHYIISHGMVWVGRSMVWQHERASALASLGTRAEAKAEAHATITNCPANPSLPTFLHDSQQALRTEEDLADEAEN